MAVLINAMKFALIFILSQSIFFPFIAGLVSARRIGRVYRPFFLLIAAGVTTELISTYLIKIRHMSNAPYSNIYVLVEWLLICWQFHVWGAFRNKRPAYLILLITPVLIWVLENLLLGGITDFPPYFRVSYSCLIVLLSVNKINFMITHENRNLSANSQFLICIAFIIFFIYKILYEWAYQTSIHGASEVTDTIIYLFGYINALTNIIFTIAFLLLPPPRKFTLH